MKPWEVGRMSFRDFELFAEGVQEGRDWLHSLFVQNQVNQINAQIPRGKPNIRMDELLPPPRAKPEDEASEFDIELARQEFAGLSGRPASPEDQVTMMEARMRLARARTQEKELRAMDRAFWEGEQGRRIEVQQTGSDVEGYLEE